MHNTPNPSSSSSSSSHNNNPVPNPFDPNDPNEAFICPIKQELMTDPVVAADGRTYEREAIVEWFQACKVDPTTNRKVYKSPMTNEVISNDLKPNVDLRAAIEEHKKLYAEYEKEHGKSKDVEKKYTEVIKNVVSDAVDKERQMTKERSTLESQVKYLMYKEARRKEKKREEKREKEEMKQRLAAVEQDAVETKEHLESVKTELDNFKASAGASKKRAKELEKYYKDALFRQRMEGFWMGSGITIAGNTALLSAFMGMFVGIGSAFGAGGAAVGALTAPAIVVGTFTLPVWGTVLAGGLCFSVLSVALVYGGQVLTGGNHPNVDKAMAAYKNGGDISTLSKEIGFTLSGVLHCLNYVLCEIGKNMQDLLCTWSKNKGYTKEDKEAFLKVRHNTLADLEAGKQPEYGDENGVVLMVYGRMRYIKAMSYMPTSDQVPGPHKIADSVIKEGNSLLDQGDKDKVEAQKSVLLQLSTSTIAATRNAFNADKTEIDFAPVIEGAVKISGGWRVKESKFGEAPSSNQGHAKQD